jgi:branched-chain amino acid transport system substrate-binding protein
MAWKAYHTAAVVTASIALLALGGVTARADGTIKVGVVDSFSGPFADFGEQIGNGISLYMRKHGDTVAGKKIEIINRDSGGPNPDKAKQLVQDLIVRDKVDFIAGLDFTPNALAAAPLLTEARKPAVLMLSATQIVTEKSPYFVRFSFSIDMQQQKFGEWAAKAGMKDAYIVVSDYVSGNAAGDSFTKGFVGAGGTISGRIGVPLSGADLAPYVQRIADAKPGAIYVFLLSTKDSVAFTKLYVQMGLKKAGTKLLGATDLFEASNTNNPSDDAIGAYSVQQYAHTHDSALNRQYVKDYAAAFGTKIHPDFMSVAGYDGMAGIYRVAEKLKGEIDGDKAMAIFKGMAFESPRGPIKIEADSRDITEPIYIRQIERQGGELINKEIFEFPGVVIPHG